MTLNFDNNMFTPVVFLDVKKAFDTIWHSGLLYKLSVSLIKLINYAFPEKIPSIA
jgi:hypothetical protein